MDLAMQTAISGWGLAALAFAALSAAGFFFLRGQVRVFAGSLAAVVAVVLLVAGALVARPDSDVGPDPLAGLQTGVPGSDRELAERLLERAEVEIAAGEAVAARATYEQARSLYRKERDILGEGRAALGMARLDHGAGQYERARASYLEAVSQFRTGGSSLWQAQALAWMGDLERKSGNLAGAAELYAEAREEWARARRPRETDHPILAVEEAPDMPNGESAAREALAAASDVYAALGDPGGVAEVALLWSRLELNAGQALAARAGAREAYAGYGELGEAYERAEAALLVANADIMRGYNLDADYALGVAEQLFLEANAPDGVARVRLARGHLERLQGRLVDARAHYAAAALDLSRLNHAAEGWALLGFAEVERFTGDANVAEQSFERAIGIFERSGDARGEARAKLALAGIARMGGYYLIARPLLEDAADLFEQTHNTLGRALVTLELARMTVPSPPSGPKDILIGEATALFEEAAAPFGLVLIAISLGDDFLDEEMIPEAAEIFAEARATLEGMDSMLAEVGKYLWLSPTDTLGVRPGGLDAVFREPAPAAEADPAAVAANLAAFPAHHAEAVELLTEIDAYVADGFYASFGEPQN